MKLMSSKTSLVYVVSSRPVKATQKNCLEATTTLKDCLATYNCFLTTFIPSILYCGFLPQPWPKKE